MSTTENIKAAVDEHVIKYINEDQYNYYVNGMSNIDLANINEADVQRVIWPFLLNWGKMARRLGQERFSDWTVKLSDKIRLESGVLRQFQSRNIEVANLSNYKEEIIRLHDSFSEATYSSIASAKY